VKRLNRLFVFVALFGVTRSGFSAQPATPDIVFADFESDDYSGWQVSGQAFGPGPARGTLAGQMRVSGFKGRGLVNSFYKGDDSIGSLTSPEFRIERRYITFLIGGGGYEGKTCMNLLVGNQAVLTATGPNTQSGGNEELSASSWDVGQFQGKTARLQIIDNAKGGWGHINVDQIVFTDTKPAGLSRNATRELVLERRLLNFPVRTGATKRRLAVLIDAAIVREFEIELADRDPEWWGQLDVSAWKGQNATLRVDKLPDDSTGLKLVDQTDEPKGSAYDEPLRPQFHFSPRRGWNNDPNGLVFLDGEYHLFFQHNPYGWGWGNMHWGHAISKDLVHWRELPIALYPRKFGDWAFSGSAVVDKKNTSGWKTGRNDLLVGAYTSTDRGECIVYSNDRGRTWKEFEGNPVIKHEGRDPRLLWHQPTRRWVMAVYEERPKEAKESKQNIDFYTSPDLKSWTFQSRIPGFFECPDLFELPVDGGAKKWVLTAASSEYMIGDFDGTKFVPATPKLPGHRGDGFYAAQTFNDMPDDRCVQIGWGRYDTPGMPFNQMMCFPCELSLRTMDEGIRLCFRPVRELRKLQGRQHTFPSGVLRPEDNPLKSISYELLDLEVELALADAKEIGLNLRGTVVSYNAVKEELVCKNHRVPLKLKEGKIKVQMLVDRTSLEIFAEDGAVYMPVGATPKASNRSYSIFAKGGNARINLLQAHELMSAWK
jgi:fructan beta-fructosidase